MDHEIPGRKSVFHYKKFCQHDERISGSLFGSQSIISQGEYDKQDYAEYLKSIRSLTDHILGKKFSPEIAAGKACSVMYLAASALTQTAYPNISDADRYAKERLAYIRKVDLVAYSYLVEAT